MSLSLKGKKAPALTSGALLKIGILGMETPGVEPGSEKANQGASTSVSCNLEFAQTTRTRTLSPCYLDNLSGNLRELIPEHPGLFDALALLPGQEEVGRLLIKQLVVNYYWHL